MKRISINMISKADSVKGQGVGSAYLEQVKLLKEGASDIFDIKINDIKEADITHHHTIDPFGYLKIKTGKSINVCYVHFLPETLDGSINLPKPVFDMFKKYVIDFYRSADYLIVVNPIFINELVKYKIRRERIKYIPNYVSKKDFYSKPTKEINELRKELKIDKNDFVVLGVGQVQTRKGVLDFIEVAKKLPDIKFIWCGGFSFGAITDGYKELKKVVENPPANVKFLGIIPREKMNDMYNVADVLFMPSYNELFPMSILEASNLHKPLLLRNLDLYKDILFGNYVSADDNEGFTKLLKKLKDDKEFYKENTNKSKNISDFYSKENVLKIWREFYTKIYNDNIHKHLVFLDKIDEKLDKILSRQKTMIARGGSSSKNLYRKVKANDILYLIVKDGTNKIRGEAKVKSVIHTEKLDKEEALDLIIGYQDKLHLTANDIKKWANKPYLTLITLDDVKKTTPFKMDGCDYVNLNDWITLEEKEE